MGFEECGNVPQPWHRSQARLEESSRGRKVLSRVTYNFPPANGNGSNPSEHYTVNNSSSRPMRPRIGRELEHVHRITP